MSHEVSHDVVFVFAMAEGSTFLFALFSYISRGHLHLVCFSSLPRLELDMPAPTLAPFQSEPSTARMPPQSIQTQLTSSTNPMDNTQTPPSAGPGAVDSSVIPPSHVARTIILCFGDQFGTDICADPCSPWSPSTDR